LHIFLQAAVGQIQITPSDEALINSFFARNQYWHLIMPSKRSEMISFMDIVDMPYTYGTVIASSQKLLSKYC